MTQGCNDTIKYGNNYKFFMSSINSLYIFLQYNEFKRNKF